MFMLQLMLTLYPVPTVMIEGELWLEDTFVRQDSLPLTCSCRLTAKQSKKEISFTVEFTFLSKHDIF